MIAPNSHDSEPPPPLEASPLTITKLIRAEHIALALDNPRSENPRDRWNERRATRWLKVTGVGFQLTPRGEWVTTLRRLRDKYPDIADLLLLQVTEDELDDIDDF